MITPVRSFINNEGEWWFAFNAKEFNEHLERHGSTKEETRTEKTEE